MGFLSDNFVSVFFVNAMEFFRNLIGIADPAWSLAIAIIIFTVIIRILLLPLDIFNRKQAVKLYSIQGKLLGLKERYKDPRVLNEKTRELYKKAKYKPLAGCLPMLLQMFIFFAFFGALAAIANAEQIAKVYDLNNAIQTGQSAHLQGWLWVHNFWQPDSGLAQVMPDINGLKATVTGLTNASQATIDALKNNIHNFNPDVLTTVQSIANTTDGSKYLPILQAVAKEYPGVANGWFILPVVSVVIMALQIWLSGKQNPATQGKQNKIMMFIMPAIFLIVGVTSNSAFAFYWLVSSIIGIAAYLILAAVIKMKKPEDDEEGVPVVLTGGKAAITMAKGDYSVAHSESSPDEKITRGVNPAGGKRRRKKGKRAH